MKKIKVWTSLHQLTLGILLGVSLMTAMIWYAVPAKGQQQVQPVAGVLTLNIVPGTTAFKVILSANVTSVVIQNPTPGTIISVIFTQNATGGFLVTFGGNIANPCLVATSANTTTTCQFQYDANSNTWNGIGGGSGGTAGQFSVKTYGAVGDAHSTRDCAVTLNSTTVTSASNPWVAADAGKFIYTSSGYGNPPFAPQKITGFNSAGSITVTNPAAGGGTSPCTWYTQKDDTAFAAALAAAKATLQSSDPQFSSPTLGYPATVLCPPGGYALSTVFFNQVYVTAQTNGVNFQGAGRNSCIIYITPDYTAGANAVFGYINQASNFHLDGFTIQGDGMTFTLGNLPGFYISNDNQSQLTNFTIAGFNNSQDGFGLVYLFNGTQLTLENLYLLNGQTLLTCTGSGFVLGLNNVLSNGAGVNMNVNCGGRGGNAQGFTWVGGQTDECGSTTTACTTVQSGVVANFIGTALYGESATAGALNCLGRCYLTDMDVGSFNNNGNFPALVIGAGAFVHANGTWFRGNGTSSAINGPSTATFIDGGNNRFMTGTGTVFTDVTAAQYATLGFTGGIVPTTAIQMPTNTVYAVTGNLLATAQNLATIPLTVNQQLTSIRAQSGGTTPANSSCATPPVITFSDGTRSATLTMTSGKTQWTSSVDAVTNLNQVFATGTTLTISIGANTCATPPVNVSVSYNVQSVLNP